MTFNKWLAGETKSFVYFRGYLASAKLQDRDDLKCANDAWNAAVRGHVGLVQKRNQHGTFDYIAVRGKFEGPRPVRWRFDDRSPENDSKRKPNPEPK